MDLRTPDERSGCPTWDTLAAFHNGLLPVPELEAVAGHLTGCSHCEAILHDLDDDPSHGAIAARLRQGWEGPSLLNESGWARMQARAEAVLDAGSTTDSTASESAELKEGSPWLGQAVGHYEILEELGRGGMGVVYRARQKPIGRLVALKMILAGPHADEQRRARFETEGKATARLEHPNVVRIYDFAEHEGLPYYTMELVEGESLKARLARGPLEPREAAELVARLARAVEHAHRNRVLHRDLKPGNVLLAADGTPKVADFGLAKLLDLEGSGPTQSNALLGTACYMAPEQAEGLPGGIGSAADVWALGVILYECLTGRPPFRGETTLKTLELVRRAEPPAPSSRQQGIPRLLEDICLTCLQKAPVARYPSAGALADDLERWLKGERPTGTPAWPRRLGRGLWRALRRPAVLLCLGLALLGGVAAYLLSPDPTKRPADENFPASAKRPADEVALERIQRELDAGRAVTLIDQAGSPAWYRWRTGKSASVALLTTDGTFTIRSFSTALVDLLPDPRHESYRITAQVRHTRSMRAPSGLPPEVGLFFACQAYPGAHADIQFFTQLTFDDVDRGFVQMFPHVHSEEDRVHNYDWRIRLARGLGFQPAREGLGGWRDLEVTITPTRLIARWEGSSIALSPAEIQKAVARNRDWLLQHSPRLSNDPFVQQLRPAFNPRGSLGLYVMRGSASFRSVTVTPVIKSSSPPP